MFKKNSQKTILKTFIAFLNSVEFKYFHISGGRFTSTQRVMLFCFLLTINTIVHLFGVLLKVFFVLCAYYVIVLVWPELNIIKSGL